MWNLRTKLTLSHILPILVLMPILSLYLLYSIEGVFTETLLQQLAYQARLLADDSERDPTLVADPAKAQALLARVSRLTDARVILLSEDGTILGSTRSEDAERVGQRHPDPSVLQALDGESSQGIGPGFTSDVAYVVLPLQYDGVIKGAVRVSYEVDDFRIKFGRLQWLILVGVALTATIGLVLGLGLAATITHPLRQLSESTENIAARNYRARVRVRSGDEVGALAQSFNRMAERLEEAEQARERQLASIVHELARPLTVMRAAVETLRDGVVASAEMRDAFLGSLQEEFTRLERLIGTLQGLHKRTLRPIQLNRTEVLLERVLRASAASFELVAAQRGIRLAVEIPSDLPRIRADEDRLIQVVTNLLDNAFKFTPPGGAVTIQAGRDDAAAWVRVADTGVGIAPNELPHVFEEFYSGDASRPPEKRGMGLGLAICQEIVAAHNGRIEVESEVGQGARVTFTLPLG